MPSGVVPRTVAVLSTEPASTSACVSVYVPAQVVEAPGSSVVVGQVAVTRESSTVTVRSVSVPVFVAEKL